MRKMIGLFAAALVLGLCALTAHAASDYTVQGNMLPTTLNADYTFGGNLVKTAPATQAITAAAVITADACGSIKAINSTGAQTTNTTHSITAPSTALAGCCMKIFNADDTDTITIDANTTIIVGAAANLAVTALDFVTFCCDGTNWRQVTPLLSNN